VLAGRPPDNSPRVSKQCVWTIDIDVAL
jgi:hypothetical protein